MSQINFGEKKPFMGPFVMFDVMVPFDWTEGERKC